MTNPIEEMTSKGMGKAKAAKASVKGLKGVFKQLAEEHGEVSALLKRVSMSNDPSVRAELFPKIRKELLSHERGELDELYPLLRQHDETRQMAQDHDSEANEMEALLAQLQAERVEAPQWGENFSRLADIVEHHAREEENEYFPRAQEVLGEQKAVELEQRYLSAKQAFMQQLD